METGFSVLFALAHQCNWYSAKLCWPVGLMEHCF